MSQIQIVQSKNVMSQAIKLVRGAKRSLFLTMNLSEELADYSVPYMKLLRKRIISGLRVRRIGFGLRKDATRIAQQFELSTLPKNFTFQHQPDIKLFQRLLIADEHKMIFAVYVGKEKFVFYTESKEIIKGFVTYFKKVDSLSKKVKIE